MKKDYISLRICWLLLSVLFAGGLLAQRPMEKLGRGLLAQKISNGIYVNWRINADEWYNTYYKVYRDGSLIYTTKTAEASNYLDASGTILSKYSVSKVKNGVESAQSAQVSVNTKGYIEVPMHAIKHGYALNDAAAADKTGYLKRTSVGYATCSPNCDSTPGGSETTYVLDSITEDDWKLGNLNRPGQRLSRDPRRGARPGERAHPLLARSHQGWADLSHRLCLPADGLDRQSKASQHRHLRDLVRGGAERPCAGDRRCRSLNG